MKKRLLALLICFAMVFALVPSLALAPAADSSSVQTVPGDFDGSGSVDTRDVIYMRQYIANYNYDTSTPSANYPLPQGCDMNGDGKINTLDLVALREYFVKYYLTITENSGSATVETGFGLSYTATGYTGVRNNAFVFTNGLTVTFDDAIFADEFNRVSFEYKTTEPLKLSINYTIGGAAKTDYFYLLPEDTSFRGLIEGYLDSKKGTALKSLTIDTCEDVEAEFALYDFKTEVIEKYADELRIENERYKIGVTLSRGGSLTYFEDRNYSGQFSGNGDGQNWNDSWTTYKNGNLINIEDAGRLIQQSFYGTTGNDEYTPGSTTGNSTWPYNPVQGGDKNDNGSTRLVDVETGVDEAGNQYIYIITQPYDWGKTKSITPLYYENRYTLKSDHVVVDNVATDFSGWTHAVGDQEMPAMYVVSKLNTFTYYNGTKPWTDDAEGLITINDMSGGWNDARYINITNGNTENWALWQSESDNFGFGIYCPNTQRLIAIKNNTGSGGKTLTPTWNASAESCSYIAPSNTMVIKSYDPIEYSYILASGTPDSIRSVFKANKDFTDNADLDNNRFDMLISPDKIDMTNIDLSKEENADILNSFKNLYKEYDEEEQALRIEVGINNDPYAILNFDANASSSVNASDFDTILIEYMLPESNSNDGSTKFNGITCYFTAGSVTSFSETYMASTSTLKRDGQYHVAQISVPAGTAGEGDIHRVRLSMFRNSKVGDEVYIKSIAFVKTPTLGTEMDFTNPLSSTFITSSVLTDYSYDYSENALKLVATGYDVNIGIKMSSLGLSTSEYKKLVIEYMMPERAESYNCFIYHTGSGTKELTGGNLVADGEKHTLTIDFTNVAAWNNIGTIDTLRIDYLNGPNVTAEDVMYIYSIKLVK